MKNKIRSDLKGKETLIKKIKLYGRIEK